MELMQPYDGDSEILSMKEPSWYLLTSVKLGQMMFAHSAAWLVQRPCVQPHLGFDEGTINNSGYVSSVQDELVGLVRSLSRSLTDGIQELTDDRSSHRTPAATGRLGAPTSHRNLYQDSSRCKFMCPWLVLYSIRFCQLNLNVLTLPFDKVKLCMYAVISSLS